MQFELTKDFINELKTAIENGSEQFVYDNVKELHCADIAEILYAVNMEEAKYIYRKLDEEKASDVLVELDEDVREKFLKALSAQEIADQVHHMDSDDAADVINELPEAKKQSVISKLENEKHSEDITSLLDYEEDTAGSIMAKEMITVKAHWPVSVCIREMREQAKEVEFVYTVYVVDHEDKLVGMLSLKSLLFAEANTLVKDIYIENVKSVNAFDATEDVAKIMEKYDLVAVPVVDNENKLLGRITIDDVVDVIKEEAEKDYQMASGISEKVESSDSVWMLSRARLPWLLIGLLGGILGAQVIGLYEHELQIYPEMAFFIPLIAAMGGNVGVQSSAIIVQGLANKTIDFRTTSAKLLKELGVALINGLACSIIIFLFILVIQGNLNLGITVSIALMIVIIAAGLFGTFIPLLLNKYKIDPALATGPFITTMNDVLGLLLYFIIGWLLYFG
ncbi:MAG: magnesium transporter [Flavobacteriales bacterium]|nr:magnesium transporter [Flavobacteriales bacterium]